VWAKGLSENAIHTDVCPLYRYKCFTRPAMHVLQIVDKVLLMMNELVWIQHRFYLR